MWGLTTKPSEATIDDVAIMFFEPLASFNTRPRFFNHQSSDEEDKALSHHVERTRRLVCNRVYTQPTDDGLVPLSLAQAITFNSLLMTTPEDERLAAFYTLLDQAIDEPTAVRDTGDAQILRDLRAVRLVHDDDDDATAAADEGDTDLQEQHQSRAALDYMAERISCCLLLATRTTMMAAAAVDRSLMTRSSLPAGTEPTVMTGSLLRHTKSVGGYFASPLTARMATSGR